MLVQSHLDSIRVLPPLPKAWSEGAVRGLRVQGGYQLDLTWNKGKLLDLVLRGISHRQERCTVRYGNAARVLAVPHGGHVVLRAADFPDNPPA